MKMRSKQKAISKISDNVVEYMAVPFRSLWSLQVRTYGPKAVCTYL